MAMGLPAVRSSLVSGLFPTGQKTANCPVATVFMRSYAVTCRVRPPYVGRPARAVLLGGCSALLFGCAAPLHINDIQVVATHNSYKQRMDAHLFALLARENAARAR